jgi:glyoxylase-like metal-dependent hydrolase (beta-lactamase superfamily II)
MITIHHLNCGTIQPSPNLRAICHALLLEDKNGLALVDTGVGLLDMQQPAGRLGMELVERIGFVFDEREAAVRQIQALGFKPTDVTHAVLTHADCDHVGGLADMPHLQVHIAAEELASVERGHWRYLPTQFAHGPHWRPHGKSDRTWFGLEARPLPLGLESEVLLIPLFGHTLGHSGVAIQQGDRWLLHTGDAYYLRIELDSDRHPVSRLAAERADDDPARRASIEQLRRLLCDHGNEIEMFCYHDPGEFPAE